jgi:hypothetical protein
MSMGRIPPRDLICREFKLIMVFFKKAWPVMVSGRRQETIQAFFDQENSVYIFFLNMIIKTIKTTDTHAFSANAAAFKLQLH